MKMKSSLILIPLVMALSGCAFLGLKSKTAKQSAKPAQVTVVQAATSTANAAATTATNAQANVDTKSAERLSQVKANIDSARSSNQANPPGTPKVQVEGELSIADNRLSDVQPDPVEVAAAAQRALLVEQGKTAEAQLAYQNAANDGKAQASAITKAQADRDQANKDRDAAFAARDKAVSDFAAQVEKNRIANQKIIDDANNAATATQVHMLDLAALACLALFGLGLGFGGAAGLKLSWPFGVFSVLCFGLAQIIAQWWFMWACGGAIVIAGAAAAWWVYKHYKLGTLKEAAEAKVTQVTGVLGQMVPVLDNAYEAGDAATKAVLDNGVFSPLSQMMNRDEKALIHTVRATVTAPVIPPGTQVAQSAPQSAPVTQPIVAMAVQGVVQA